MKKTIALLIGLTMLLSLLAGCGGTAAPAAPAQPQQTAEPAAAPEEPAKAEETAHAPAEGAAPGGVATAEDMTAVEEVVEEGMVPVYAESLVDGVYPVAMKSSSSMFKAEHCDLIVENGKMRAVLHMKSEAYPYMFAGTAAEAAANTENGWIPLTEGTFSLPLNALDSGEAFAAYSKRKELWYDRTLLFRADSLPVEAFAEGHFTTAERLGLADGDYTAAVTLSGGSGKARVESPARLRVAGGACTAEIVWSSANYDYMKVGGERFDPLSLDPVSVFVIPVAYFDRPMTVYADTTAMSQPYEIEYTLSFDSASLLPA